MPKTRADPSNRSTRRGPAQGTGRREAPETPASQAWARDRWMKDVLPMNAADEAA
jgi:hypothetical protein